MYLIGFPLLLIPFVLYNMVAYLLDLSLTTTLFNLPLLSNQPMPVTAGDTLVILGIVLLYIEILKAARLAGKAIMEHVLSLLLFGAMLAEFLMVPRAATSTFLVLMTLSFVDVIGGFTIAIRKTRRDIPLEPSDRVASNY